VAENSRAWHSKLQILGPRGHWVLGTFHPVCGCVPICASIADCEQFLVAQRRGSAILDYIQVSRPIYLRSCARLTTLQRLKGAIDSRIAEEQARQRTAVQSASPSRTGSDAGRRSLSRNLSPSKRPRPREKADLPAEKGPDPSEFDSDFAAGSDTAGNDFSKKDASEQNVEARKTDSEGAPPGTGETKMNMENGEVTTTPAQRNGELPTDVRVKLRKLERVEGRYQELLRAYRIAHARIQKIEPFETSLRENTPLTSISDPSALLEYLNQISLKSDMVLDELKRVAGERDEYRKKLDVSEKETQALKDEVAKLRQQETSSSSAAEQPASFRQSHDLSNMRDSASATAIESATSRKSPTPSTSSRMPSFSLFSPKSKAVKSPREERDAAEEFFSYDNELPRLENELRDRHTEIVDLKKQVFTLQGDLSVARESTEGMVQSLEAATRELHALRDTNEKYESTRGELQIKLEGLEQEIASLTSRRAARNQEDSDLESQLASTKAILEEKERVLSSNSEAEEERKFQVIALENDAAELRERIAQKDATVKDLEDSLAMAKSAERQQAQQSWTESASQKQIGILNNIMDSLRSQLKTAEQEIIQLKEIKRRAEVEIEDLLELKTHNDRQEEARSKLTDEAVERYVAHTAEQPSTRYFGFVNNEEFSLSGDAPTAFRQFSEIVKNTRPDLYEALIYPERSKDKTLTSSESPAATDDVIKKNKKKKRKNKGGQAAFVEQTVHDPPAKVTEPLSEARDGTQKPNMLQSTTPHHLEKQITDLESQIQEKDTAIARLSGKLKDQDALNEEIETLRDDLLHQGEEHVEARDALKAARIENSDLEGNIAAVEKELTDLKAHSTAGSAESKKVHDDLLSELEEAKTKSSALERDLMAAEQLAVSRFKDITDLRELLSKTQSELKSLRAEVEELRSAREELKSKMGELTRLESRHEDLKADIKNLSRKIGEKDGEIKDLRQKHADGNGAKTKAEDDLRIVRLDFQTVEAARDAAISAQQQSSKELSKTKAEYATSRNKVRELEEAVNKHTNQIESLQEDIRLKTSLHDSTQAIMTGLREQTLELNTQAREASARADSLEEELAEAQRMLSERSREGETMRRLLADVEGRTSTKVREMKERMETAIDERDRVEDEASTSNRRMAREVEDLRNKAREATRSLKIIEEEKEELERSQRDLKRRRDDLEGVQERAQAEVGEAQAAVQQLREALDQREREGMELERQKTDMKRMLEEVQERVERLQNANKGLTDELNTMQQRRKGSVRPTTGLQAEVPSSRTSMDSSGANARNNSVVGSPAPNIRDKLPTSRSSTPTGSTASTIDYVYLKNVLLQFLEQKDKNHQKQLIPVLGMLLNFDR
jgi:chromosome segregation ATPase